MSLILSIFLLSTFLLECFVFCTFSMYFGCVSIYVCSHAVGSTFFFFFFGQKTLFFSYSYFMSSLDGFFFFLSGFVYVFNKSLLKKSHLKVNKGKMATEKTFRDCRVAGKKRLNSSSFVDLESCLYDHFFFRKLF